MSSWDLAHELRNPLALIRNGCSPRLGGFRSYVDRARTDDGAADDGMFASGRLLDVSRINPGTNWNCARSGSKLAAVLNSAIETSRPLIEQMATNSRSRCRVACLRRCRLTAGSLSQPAQQSAKYTERGGHIWLTAERQENVGGVCEGHRHRIAADQLPTSSRCSRSLDHSLEPVQAG